MAFQDVEDNLVALRVLADEALQARDAVASANRSLELANNRYVGGVTDLSGGHHGPDGGAGEPDHGRRCADATDDGERPVNQGARRWVVDCGFALRLCSSCFDPRSSLGALSRRAARSLCNCVCVSTRERPHAASQRSTRASNALSCSTARHRLCPLHRE